MAKERDALFNTPTSVRLSTTDIPIFEQKEGGKQSFIGAGQQAPSGFGFSQFVSPASNARQFAPTDGFGAGGGGIPAGGGASPLLATSGSFMDQFGDALSRFSETPEEAEARRNDIRKQFTAEKERILGIGEEELDVFGARKAKGSRGGGTAFDSIIDNQIEMSKKRVDKAIKENEDALATALREDNTSAKEQARKNLIAASDLSLKLSNQAIQREQLKLQQLTGQRAGVTQEFQIRQAVPIGKTIEIGGQTFEGLAQPSIDTQAFTDSAGNVTIVDLNTGNPLGVIEGIGKTEGLEFKTVNGRIFTFDPATGLTADSGITVPKQSVAGAGTGTGAEDLSPTIAAVTEAANRIIDMESLGEVSPDSYWALVNELATDMGWNPDDTNAYVIGKIQELKGEAPVSDFETETPTEDTPADTTPATTDAGKAVGGFLARGGILPEAVSTLGWANESAKNFLKGLTGIGTSLSAEEISELNKKYGGSF